MAQCVTSCILTTLRFTVCNDTEDNAVQIHGVDPDDLLMLVRNLFATGDITADTIKKLHQKTQIDSSCCKTWRNSMPERLKQWRYYEVGDDSPRLLARTCLLHYMMQRNCVAEQRTYVT